MSCRIFCSALWNAGVCSPAFALPTTPAFSSSSAMRFIASATIVLRITFGAEQEADEPGARNSNLLPVKANGDVRLRSVASFGSAGSVSTPIFIVPACFELFGAPFSSCAMTSASWSPR